MNNLAHSGHYNNRATILVADKSHDAVNTLLGYFSGDSFAVLHAMTGEDTVQVALREGPSTIVLEAKLSYHCGFDVIQVLKSDRRTREIPILMLTAKSEVSERIACLESGADDCLTKPFEPLEIVVRVKALLRRFVPLLRTKIGSFWLDESALMCYHKLSPIELTVVEFKLLRRLLLDHNSTVPRETLLRDVWDYVPNALSRTLDTHIKRLRRKLLSGARCIKTVRGIGYRLDQGDPQSGLTQETVS